MRIMRNQVRAQGNVFVRSAEISKHFESLRVGQCMIPHCAFLVLTTVSGWGALICVCLREGAPQAASTVQEVASTLSLKATGDVDQSGRWVAPSRARADKARKAL